MKNKLFSAAYCKGVINEKEQIVHVIASTGVVDRHGESVNPLGWKLENYLKNPVVLIAHDYRSLPIGKVIKIWVEENQLHAYIQIADTKAGQEVFYLISKGFLNTVSVGFIPTKYGVAGQDQYTIMEAELLEISFVAVPANPEALIDNSVQQRFAYLEKSIEEANQKKEEKNNEIRLTKDEYENLKAKAKLGEDIKEAMKEVLKEVKVVEEKVVEKIIEVNKKDLSPQAIKLLSEIRSQMRKSDRYSGISLKLLNSLLKVKNSK